MEPLTTLSIVTSVVQLIDFGSKIIANTRAVYKTADGITQETRSLSLVASDIQDLTATLQKSLQEASSGAPLCTDAKVLDQLGRECAAVAGELLDYLKAFSTTTKPSVWRSVDIAFRVVWTKPRRDGLMAQLQNLRAQFLGRVLLGIRSVARLC